MAYIVNNKSIKHVGVLTEPNSYQTDIKSEDMQCGSTAVSKGKVVTGTGRCFESAGYGERYVEDDGESSVISIFTRSCPNVVLIASTTEGDVVLQHTHKIDFASADKIEIGVNRDSAEGVYASYANNVLTIYTASMVESHTRLKYFYGKDNLQ